MSSRIYLDQIYSKSGLTKIIDTSSFDSNNFFESSNTGFKVNYQSSNAALEVIQSGTGNAMTVNTDKFVLDKNGNLNIAGNLTFPNSYGINFGNTTLDDYEEGTWVPNVFHVSTNDSTWLTKQGFYIKIGRQVTLWGRCDSGNSGTSGSGLRLNGFPFSAATSPVFAHAVGSFTYNGTAAHADKWQLVNALHADSYGEGNHVTQVSYIGFFLTYYTD